MKTCLALTSLAALSLHSLTSAQDQKFPELLRKADVTISQNYTPFGNKLEFNKFGDDGSSCVLDANGVLTWIDNTGVVRVLPNSDLAVPLYVTATECLVWNNRFVDHSSYKNRPKAEIKLYRAQSGSAALTEQLITIEGVEVLDTPSITTTTASFTFITTTRKDNEAETPTAGAPVNNSDDCEIRVYRVTAEGSVQLLKTDNREVKRAPNFDTNTAGPDVSALSYGSDGAVVLNIADAYLTRQADPNYIQQVLWLDDQGNSKEVSRGAAKINIFSTSKTRLLYKEAPDNDLSLNISLDNGDSTTGITPAPTSADTTTGVVNGSLQVETATAAGTPVGTSPTVRVIVTAAGLVGSPKTYEVGVSDADTTASWAGKVRAKLNDDAALKALYDVSGTSAKIVLTRKAGSSYDLRRSASVPTAISLPLTMNAPLAGYTIKSEQPIDFFDFTSLSDKRFIHTLGTLDGAGPLDETSVISTYQITSTNPILVSRAAPGIQISSAALVAAVDPVDGSALITDEENAPIIWLHSGTGTGGATTSTNYSVIPNSGQGKELYVTNSQAVIWENADAAKNANGSIPAPIVKHYSRNTTTGALTASPIYLDGSVLLNTPRSTPAADYWLITTAEKPNAATATLRTYALRDGSNIDTDGDGLVDAVENNTGTYASKALTGTDPYDADTDDDGVNDGDEVYALEITDPALSWAAAKTAAEARGGWLATIADADEHKALVRKIGQRSFSSYWLGAADTEATQVETATAAGTITGNGTANATITASGLTGGNKTISVPVTANDTATTWAAKVRAALVADTAVATLFNVSGSGSEIVLARKTRVTNDGTLNLALSNGTSTGITDALTSANTRASAARAARTFRWVDFTSFDSTLATSLFRPGEPNGIAGLNALSLRNDFKWTDDPATEARSYVVEYPWSDPTSTDTDADGLADNEERTLGGNPNNPDTDSDGLTDGVEKTAGTSLILVDTDGDTLTDYAERIDHNTDPLKKDTDGDALEDDDEISLGTLPRDTDTDNDNLTDGDEVTRGTNPKLKDTDTDGLDDDKEVLVHLTDPNDPDSDGDGLDDSEEVSKGTDPNNDQDPKVIDTDKDNLTNFDEIYVHNTDPKKADTDGDGINDDVEIAGGGNPRDAESDTDRDGLKDRFETNTRVFVSKTSTGTDPYNPDTDNDTLLDKVETGTRVYKSLSDTGTDPNFADTDVDGLTDGEEINGVSGYTSNPFMPDGDGDLVNDFDEVYAGTTPGSSATDPKDGTSYPTGVTFTALDLHSAPSMVNDVQTVSIEEGYSPFGHRPEAEKTGEDGSVGLRDRNGVVVWIDKEGAALTVEDSGLAKILYISNTECVLYNNRYAPNYGSRGSSSEVVIYRREAGTINSSSPIVLPGTLNDTAPVTPNTYGFTLMTSSAGEDGNESKQRTEAGAVVDINGAITKVYETNDVDKWDSMSHRLYRVTWDGDKQDIAVHLTRVPDGSPNLGNNRMVGFGSDGSFAFTQTVAGDLFDDVDDTDPTIFKTKTELVWVNWNPGTEGFHAIGWTDWFDPQDGPAAPELDVAYVSNERLLISEQIWTNTAPYVSTDNYNLKDYRRRASGQVNLANTFPLAAGDKPLGITSNSRKGLTPFMYVSNKAGTNLRLYRVEDSLEPLGNAISVPAKLREDLSFVRNPIDGSLLMRTELPSSVVWLTGSLDADTGEPLGLTSAQIVPRSSQALPFYVSGTEAVLWMNRDAPVASGGVIAPASISHFQIKSGRIVETTLTPPIEGRFVASPTTLTPDSESEGWYITTFEKSAARSAKLRTYRLTKTSDVDRDGDGLADLDELFYGTNPGNPDSDGDGLSDGDEVRPYELVFNNKKWEDARLEAISKGGKLLVLDTEAKQNEYARSKAGKTMSSPLWIGGHDRLVEGRYLWLNDKGECENNTTLLINKAGAFKNWALNQPNNNDNAHGMESEGAPYFKWRMGGSSKSQGYVVEYPASDPLKGDADGDGLKDGVERAFASNPNLTDTDGDGLDDDKEYARKSKPYVVDTDGDTLSDGLEVNTHRTDPTLEDTDGDGLQDNVELSGLSGMTSDPTKTDTDLDGYSDFQELKATPPTDPRDREKYPNGSAVPRGWITGVEMAAPSATITVPAGWTPLGQRTDYTKWGDDGSRVYADASGMLLWRSSEGVVRPVPNTEKAVPLIVSNSKVIVWHNAYNNQTDAPGGNGDGINPIEVYLYRLDSGNVVLDKIVSDASNRKILGDNIIATAPVTTTSNAYHLVTSGAPKGGQGDGGSSYTIYRITFTGDVQAVSSIDEGGAGDRETARAYGHGSDGSLVFYTLDQARPPEDRAEDAFWVDSARRAVTTGVWEELHNRDIEPGALGSRVLYTSGTRVVYETVGIQGSFEIGSLSRYGKLVTVDTWYDHGLKNGDTVEIKNVLSYESPSVDPNGKYVIEVISPSRFQYYLLNENPLNVREYYDEYAGTYARLGERSYPIIDARRNPHTGFGTMDNFDITPGGDYYRFLQISTQTMEGDVRYCYALNKLKDSITVYRLNNLGFQFVYAAKLPPGLMLDETATVEKINPADGSAVITSDNIDNIIWVQKTSDVEPTRNALIIPNSRLAKTMFVDGKEIVVWNNAYDGPLSNGLLGKAQILHYRHTNGRLESAIDLSSRTQGTFVMSTPIFVPTKDQWEFSTVEKIAGNQALIHNYQFTDNEMSDSDNDGVPDSVELARYNTNPLKADTDGDGIPDDEEIRLGTNPLATDSDGDGVSDYDEIFVLFTDPIVSNLFGSSSAAVTPVDYNKAKGTYQGMVLSDANGLTYHLSLSVTAKGAFTGNIQGAFGRLAIKGSLSPAGTGDLTVNNLGELSMSMRSVGSTYVISGKLESTSAGDYQFELRRAKTSQKAELLTWTAGLLSESSIHTGAAVATGTVAKNARVTFQIYNADGTRATYAGSVLDSGTGIDRGIISLFASNKQGSLLMGNMILAPNGATKNKLFGNLKFMNNSGLNQDREVAGATFVAPTVGTLPLSSFAFEINNMVMRWIDGAFDGLHKVATWLPTSVPVPLTENESATVTYDRKTGLMKALYTLTDASRKLNKTPSTAYAVTVDGFDDMIGMYMDTSSTGLFSVAPNDENLPQVGEYGKNGTNKGTVTLSSPSKDIPKSGDSYTVSAAGTGDWKVVIPANVNWLSVKVTNNNGTVSSALTGNGSASVAITVAANSTTKPREAIITIGGAPHKIRQARY